MYVTYKYVHYMDNVHVKFSKICKKCEHIHGIATPPRDREQIWEYRDTRMETGHLYILPFVCFQTGTPRLQGLGEQQGNVFVTEILQNKEGSWQQMRKQRKEAKLNSPKQRSKGDKEKNALI